MVQANFGRYDEKFHYVRGEFFLFLKVKKKKAIIYIYAFYACRAKCLNAIEMCSLSIKAIFLIFITPSLCMFDGRQGVKKVHGFSTHSGFPDMET